MRICGDTVDLSMTGYPSPSCILERGHEGDHTDGMGVWADPPTAVVIPAAHIPPSTGLTFREIEYDEMHTDATILAEAFRVCSACGSLVAESAKDTHRRHHQTPVIG